MAKQAVETTSPEQKASRKDAIPRSITFFDRMKKIDKADWGTRARIKVYRLEPIIDQLRVSSNKYIRVFDEPINEEVIKRDPSCGSGRYRLYLNFKAPTDDEKEIDSVEVEILDQNFPPKIARGVWLEDPRNEKWTWAKKHYDQEHKQPNGNGAFLEGLEVLDRLDARARDRYGNSNSVEDFDRLVSVAQKMAPQPPPPQTENKTLDSIVQMMLGQMKTQADQNNVLLQALLTQRNTPPPVAPSEKTSIKEVIALVKDEIIPLVEKLKPGDVIDGITRRSKMNGWQEMIQPAIPVVVDFLKPFAAGLATSLFARAGQPTPPFQPGMNGAMPNAAPGSPALPQGSQQNGATGAGAMSPVLNMLAPAMLNYMRLDEHPQVLGEDFASWVHEGFAADARFNNALVMARAAGPSVIITQFKGSPWWLDKGVNHDQASLAEMEGKFGVFTQAFLNWQPPQGGVEEDEDAPEVIDIG